MVAILHIGNDQRFNAQLNTETVRVEMRTPEEVSASDIQSLKPVMCVVDLTVWSPENNLASETLKTLKCPIVAFSYGIDPSVVERAKHLSGRSPLTREQLTTFVTSLS